MRLSTSCRAKGEGFKACQHALFPFWGFQFPGGRHETGILKSKFCPPRKQAAPAPAELNFTPALAMVSELLLALYIGQK